MITDFFLLLWVLGISTPIYWLVPAHWHGLRLSILITLSALFLLALSPLIFLSLLFFALVLWAFIFALQLGVKLKHLRSLSWMIFAPLLLVDFIPPDVWVSLIMGPAASEDAVLVGMTYLGISYTAIRCFIMVREQLDGRGPTVFEALAAFLFFGHFVAGPISGAAPWKSLANRLSGRDLSIGLARIFWGAAIFFVLQSFVGQIDPTRHLGFNAEGRATAWFEVYRNFLMLYLDFAGYSEIAIGSAMLYGVKLPENFRWPLRATSIQEFWQRWHLSLGRFIGTYLFNPLVRNLGKPSLAIFLAFTAVGIWHQFSITYFIWGVGHGAALAANMILRKRYPIARRPPSIRWLSIPIGWTFTMSYVALLSAIANSTGLVEAGLLVGELFF